MTSEKTLRRAVRENDTDTTKRLLKGGASTEWQADDDLYYQHAAGWWLSAMSAGGDYEGMLDLLISYGANLNPDRGVPPLHSVILWAGRHGPDVTISRIACLLSRGARINHIGDIGPGIMPMPFRGGPLHAYWASGHPVVITLLERGADTNIRDSNGRDALAFYVAYRDKAHSEREEIELILKSIGRFDKKFNSRVVTSELEESSKSHSIWRKLFGR